VFNILYVTVYSFGGYLYKKTDFKKITINKINRFVVIIPVFKSDDIILVSAKETLKQSFLREMFDVVVVADSLSQNTINELLKFGVDVVPVTFDISTKAKAINVALAVLPDDKYDYCVVLDVDNIMEYDFLTKINCRLQNNEIVIQGHRTAKNLNTSFAILDGLSEEINTHIFRRGHVGLNVSSALSGSGKAIKFDYFKEIMLNVETAVEDKEIEVILIRDKVKILYEDDAWVYDEKVQSAKVFAKQRRRWIASQFLDFNTILIEALHQLVFQNNFDFFDKALQRIILPRVLLLGFSFIMALTVLFKSIFTFAFYFFLLFLFCSISFLIATPGRYYNFRTLSASMRVPQAFFLMIMAMFKSKGATHKFLHTPHTFNESGQEDPISKFK